MQKTESQQILEQWSAFRDVHYPSVFFHIGGTQWYKNRLGLIELYAALKRSKPDTPPLLIAGKPHRARVRATIAEQNLEASVLHIGHISNQELNALYSSAEAFLFPSLAEGFGWPIIEARKPAAARSSPRTAHP